MKRRDFLKTSAAFAGAASLLPMGPFLGRAGAKSSLDSDPHFFLQVVLPGGADSSYLFDARPLAMTEAGKIQNFIGEDPTPWMGSNGGVTLATRLTQPLEPLREHFSVLNGVHMSNSFDGHTQNMNMLFSGSPFGGENYLPHLNVGMSKASLDYLQMGRLFVSNTNASNTVNLTPESAAKVSEKINSALPMDPNNPLTQFIRSRVQANAQGNGLFSRGVRQLLTGLGEAPEVSSKLGQVEIDETQEDDLMKQLDLMKEYFRTYLARSAILVLNHQLDTHDNGSARQAPERFETIAGQIRTIIEYLRNTAFDDQRSLLDVTTFMVASEFSRTMRQMDKTMDETGTDHNPFNNSILVGGRGIQTGLVIGASDQDALNDEGETEVSGAHLQVDARKLNLMGKPFDFNSLSVRETRPETYDPEDYLLVGCLVNTIYRLFQIEESRYRIIGRDGPQCRTLDGLLRG